MNKLSKLTAHFSSFDGNDAMCPFIWVIVIRHYNWLLCRRNPLLSSFRVNLENMSLG